MIERTSDRLINERIKALQAELGKVGFKPSLFLELTLLTTQLYLQEGLSFTEAHTKAYAEAQIDIRKKEGLFGSSESTRATYFELEYARRCLSDNQPDPLEVIISGVKPALLTEDSAKLLSFSTQEEYQTLIDDLNFRERLFGWYPDRANARILLTIKRNQIKDN